jgi:hypothetical protein
MRFYHIKENEDGGFTYHDFYCGWTGYRGFTCSDIWKRFDTKQEALSYAQERGATDAYGY